MGRAYSGPGIYSWLRRKVAKPIGPGSHTGWFYFIWAVFFTYVWVGSFKAGIVRMLFLLGLWLTLLALAIAMVSWAPRTTPAENTGTLKGSTNKRGPRQARGLRVACACVQTAVCVTPTPRTPRG